MNHTVIERVSTKNGSGRCHGANMRYACEKLAPTRVQHRACIGAGLLAPAGILQCRCRCKNRHTIIVRWRTEKTRMSEKANVIRCNSIGFESNERKHGM